MNISEDLNILKLDVKNKIKKNTRYCKGRGFLE